MNTVQYLDNFVDRRLIQKLFVRFANKYGNLWTSRLGENGDWKSCEDDWLEELSAFTVRDAVSAIKKSLIIYPDYPPTQGQLIELCLKESGVPSIDEVIKKMINRNFDHPMIKMAHDKIGSWQLKNGKKEEIDAKTKLIYKECLSVFKNNTKNSWLQLESYHNQPTEIFALKKIENHEEIKGFKERFSEYKKKCEEEKLKNNENITREFDLSKLKPYSRYFDENLYQEYQEYLISIPEFLVISLPASYAFDRMKFLNDKDQNENLKKLGYIELHEIECDKTKNYKSWNND
jgi:hypothetical protein